MSSGSSRGVVYTVEARSTYITPQEYAGMLLDERWQRIDFSAVPPGLGVPNHTLHNADKHGYLTYETAQALRWWFHAARPLPACIETRLVAYDYEETWKAVERGVSGAQEWPRRPYDDFAPRPASVDTHPKDGDALAAPLVSGAVGATSAETPNASHRSTGE